ncbi:Male-specific lethal 3 [Nesidiocoris tenuis]|uniref:Male-specific lethal 3 n=1 Tax=Nesidiocoris tenuis TaxID=355587 RepID=A0ABN7ATV3_9HEMI|nr:Male-specific lethal 3 [Nesidiocoris tenuis]
MVSKRSVNLKFSEGERVLCYEPDPAKTKVLYHSKVLEIIVKKDETGKRVTQFLIHFQGWNSTWDRFVTEDFILKDTEENRKLKRELAKKAQLTAFSGGGNLYRRDREKRSVPPLVTAKTRLSSPGQEPASTVEPPVNNLASSPANHSGAKAQNSSHKRRASVCDEGPAVAMNPIVIEDQHSDTETGSVPRPPQSRASQFAISPTLRGWLELDHDRIRVQNKLVKIPPNPLAVDVLQKWMVEYSVSQIRRMCHRRGHLRPSAGKKGSTVTVESITRCANLCREVADSLRILMEFGLSTMFLYGEERVQYGHVLGSIQTNTNWVWRNEPEPGYRTFDDCRSDEKPSSEMEEDENDGEARRKTLRSHSGSSCHSQCNDVKPDILLLLTNDSLSDSRGENLVLRPMSAKDKETLMKIVSRKLVPDVYRTKNYPSTIYGAIHLARVLVKVPEILANAEHGQSHLGLLVEYLNNFMRYLEDHPEWFSDDNYIDRPPTFAAS